METATMVSTEALMPTASIVLLPLNSTLKLLHFVTVAVLNGNTCHERREVTTVFIGFFLAQKQLH